MATIASNIREQMAKHRYTGLAIDREFEWAEGTLAQKLHRNENNIEHGFTVGDMAKFINLFGCTCVSLFKDVDFSRGAKNEI